MENNPVNNVPPEQNIPPQPINPSENELPVNPIFQIKETKKEIPSPTPAPAPVLTPVSTPPSQTPSQAPAVNQTEPQLKTMPTVPVSTNEKRWRVLLLVLAIVIPLSVLGYILYWNFLPFGFSQTYTLTAGALNDTSGELFFDPSPNLSGRMGTTDATGNKYSYREVYGPISVTFKPTAILKNGTISASLEGDYVSFIGAPKVPNASSTSADWDNLWDFTSQTPAGFSGSAFAFDGCTQFDGTDSLALADSKDDFENGPMSIYADWTPTDNQDSNQEIVGHYNWELFQAKDNVSFQVGRMNDAAGPFYEIKAPVSNDFFGKEHTALAVYSPSTDPSYNGYIELYIDNKFVGRTNIGSDSIWKDYGDNPLTLGWTAHNNGANPHFKGCVYQIGITSAVMNNYVKELTLQSPDPVTKFTIINDTATGTLRNIKIKANE